MSPLSTPEVAHKVGIHRVTLEKWIRAGKVKPSKRVQVGGRAFRIWTARDVERVRKWKAAHYRKGRGRKKKKKA
jgi:predicted site-specific integrase-resolvase